MIQRVILAVSFLAACTTSHPSGPPPGAVAPRPTPGAIGLALRCAALISKSARRSLLDPPPLVLELVNQTGAPVVVDEIHAFNLDTPSDVRHTNAANASFKLVRVGAPPGKQGYSCEESSTPPPVKRTLKPGESYRHPLPVEPTTLDPGEYEGEVSYGPLRLTGARCRFRVVP